MTDSQRIKEILKHLGLNQSQLAESIGYSVDMINKVVKGRDGARISINLAKAITTKYPVFNESWLLIDQGKMLNKDPNRSLSDKVIEAEISYTLEKAFEDRDKIIEQQREIIDDLKSELKQARELAKVKEDIIVQKVRDAINNQDF